MPSMPSIFPDYVNLTGLKDDDIIETLYSIFCDLRTHKPIFNGTHIYIDFEKVKNLNISNGITYFMLDSGYKIGITGLPLKINLEERFYHFISRESLRSTYGIDTIREYDEDRAARLNHIKPAIENHTDIEVTYFRYQAKKKILHVFWVKNRDYVVMVREGYKGRGYYYIDTSYCVDQEGKRQLERMFQNKL